MSLRDSFALRWHLDCDKTMIVICTIQNSHNWNFAYQVIARGKMTKIKVMKSPYMYICLQTSRQKLQEPL